MGFIKMTTELEALEDKFRSADARIYLILIELGIDPDAPTGTAKHRYHSYPNMMNTALPIFKQEASAARHDYPHIPYCVFQGIKEAEPEL